jgi:hypothetical protein
MKMAFRVANIAISLQSYFKKELILNYCYDSLTEGTSGSLRQGQAQFENDDQTSIKSLGCISN